MRQVSVCELLWRHPRAAEILISVGAADETRSRWRCVQVPRLALSWEGSPEGGAAPEGGSARHYTGGGGDDPFSRAHAAASANEQTEAGRASRAAERSEGARARATSAVEEVLSLYRIE